jgi:hypothetical protein
MTTTWWKLPFTADPWRRTRYIALAVPAAVIALADGGRLQQRNVRRLGREVTAYRLRGLLALPVAWIGFVVTLYGWSIAVLNLGYPIRWVIGLGGDYSTAWGGPTFAGAWAFHAATGGLVALFAMPWIVSGITSLHLRLLAR